MIAEIIIALVPLIQTALWVALIAFGLWRYNDPISRLIKTIHRRVESGSSVKAGPLELGEQIQPQDEQSQRNEVQKEAEEYVSGQGRQLSDIAPDEKLSIRSRIVLAEDLALRAIQDDFNEPLKRNIQFVGGFSADAIFKKNGIQHLVEVKVVTGRSREKAARTGIAQLQHSMHKISSTKTQGILSLVYLDDGDIDKSEADIRELVTNYPGIQIKLWTLSALMERYGITSKPTL